MEERAPRGFGSRAEAGLLLAPSGRMHSLLTLLFGHGFSPTGATIALVLGDLLAVAAIPSVLLRRSGRPIAALSWVLAVIAMPYVGVLAWAMLGRTRIDRKTASRREASERFCMLCPPGTREQPLSARQLDVVPFAVSGARWTDGAFPPADVSQTQVLCDGADAFEAMETAIAGAQAEIRALFYIWQADDTSQRVVNLLEQKAREGVAVRILVDAVGGRPFLKMFANTLRDAGVEIASFMPPRFVPWAPTFNFRNHRKLLLIDGDIGFVGGMNIGDEYALRWHDLAFALRGQVVDNLDDVFQEDWYATTGAEASPIMRATERSEVPATATATVIASGPEREENRVHDAFFLAITHAWQRVWLTSPYFIPSEAVLAALRGAAMRGVDVRVVVPADSDVPLVARAGRSYYPALLKAGIRLFEYQPRFSHAKAVVIDDDLTIVGSPNADVRSFRLNFELACVIESSELNETVARILVHDMSQSLELSPVSDRSTADRLIDSAAHLLSPLL